MTSRPRMYENVVTWNPFKGCSFDCTYCVPSFQRLAKMQKCEQCKTYTPHEHPERLDRIPDGKMIFVCSSGDISFCDPEYTRRIFMAMQDDMPSHPRDIHKMRWWYLQSKRPEYFAQFFEDELPPQIMLGTTLETNRDEGYDDISKAPPPQERWDQFRGLVWALKTITVEPVMDFDLQEFAEMIVQIMPLWVWLGYNSTRHAAPIPEPPHWKVRSLIKSLETAGIEVRLKEMRGLEI